MTPALVYNLTVGSGALLLAVGAGAAFGWPFGAMAGGAAMIVLAIVALVAR